MQYTDDKDKLDILKYLSSTFFTYFHDMVLGFGRGIVHSGDGLFFRKYDQGFSDQLQ